MTTNNSTNGQSDIDKRLKAHFGHDEAKSGKDTVERKTFLQPSEVKRLIPELCRHFYHLGWASGTGGGVSIRVGDLIYCAPSGVQKERIQPEDIFTLNFTGTIISRPVDQQLKLSECFPLFKVAFDARGSGCCIHSHSMNANLVTALCSDENSDRINPREFRIKNQEMIKGIRKSHSGESLKYTDTLIVPIIDNTCYESHLKDSLSQAIEDYPETSAVLVRNHGLYVWGRTWQEAKGMTECYDYLFKIKLEAFRYGFEWIYRDH